MQTIQSLMRKIKERERRPDMSKVLDIEASFHQITQANGNIRPKSHITDDRYNRNFGNHVRYFVYIPIIFVSYT